MMTRHNRNSMRRVETVRPTMRERRVAGRAASPLAAACWLLAALAASAATNAPAFGLSSNLVTAGRLEFVVGSNGLPAQITIRPDAWELPLESRTSAVAVTESALVDVGRGPQLKAPMRVEVTAAGKTVALMPVEPAAPALAGDGVVCKTRLSGGGVNAAVEAAYGRDGALTIKATYGGGAKVDSLVVVMEMNGVVDAVVGGGAPFKAADYALASEEGLLWGNAAAVAGAAATAANRGAPGVPPHLFWGSGDRGFTWLSDGDSGWTTVPSAPTMTLTREKGGSVTWRAWLVNQPAEFKGEKTVAFTLLTHPFLSRTVGHRKAQWIEWPFSGKPAQVPPLTAKARKGVSGLIRADAASVCEAMAGGLLLQGPAGGDASSSAATLADSYPLPLFRYLAGTHTGLDGRLLANSPALIRPGMDPACDRLALGRALLHDIGVDPAGVTHLAMASRLVAGLLDFGFFEADGNTEYIPYWRSRGLVRYGEAYSGQSVFEETTADPMERVRVSIWRRPADGGTGIKALILIVNEGKDPTREQFYVLDPVRLFGGRNGLKYGDVTKLWDTSSIPGDSDWSGGKLTRSGLIATGPDPKPKRNGVVLADVEDQGVTVQVADKGGMEVYGRTFVPGRGFRLLMGTAMPPPAAPVK